MGKCENRNHPLSSPGHALTDLSKRASMLASKFTKNPHNLVEIFSPAQLLHFNNRNSWAGRG